MNISFNNMDFVDLNGVDCDYVDFNGSIVWKKFNEITYEGEVPTEIKADGNDLINYQIYGNTVHSKSAEPTPDNPVDVIGVGDKTENLIPMEDDKSFTLNGVTITCRNGRIWLTGNPTGEVLNSDNPIFMQNFSFTVSAGTYNFIVKSNTDRLNLDIFRYDSDNDTYIQHLDARDTGIYTFTVDQDNAVLFLKIYYRPGAYQITHTSPLEVMVCRKEIIEYEPYGYKIPIISAGQTNNIYLSEPLHKIGDYSDYIDFNTQTISRQIKKLIFTGEESWLEDTDNTNQYVCRLDNVIQDAMMVSGKGIYACNYFVYAYTYPSDLFDRIVLYESQDYNIISMSFNKTRGITTVDEFKAFLNDKYTNKNPVTIWYVLTEPTEEQIELSSIPTNKYPILTTFNVGTEIQPSKVLLDYKGKS